MPLSFDIGITLSIKNQYIIIKAKTKKNKATIITLIETDKTAIIVFIKTKAKKNIIKTEKNKAANITNLHPIFHDLFSID